MTIDLANQTSNEVQSGSTAPVSSEAVVNYAQPKLVDSGDYQNLKTINGESLLGQGDIVIKGGGSGGGDYISTDDISKVTSPKQGTITYVRKGKKTVALSGVGITGVDRTVLNYNEGAKILVNGNGISNYVYIEHSGSIYSTINGVGVIDYSTDWQEIAEGLYVKGSTTGTDDTNASFYVAGTSDYTITIADMDTTKYPNAKSVTVSENASVDVNANIYFYNGSEWVGDLNTIEMIIDTTLTGDSLKAKWAGLKALYDLGIRPSIKWYRETSYISVIRYQLIKEGDSVRFDLYAINNTNKFNVAWYSTTESFGFDESPLVSSINGKAYFYGEIPYAFEGDLYNCCNNFGNYSNGINAVMYYYGSNNNVRPYQMSMDSTYGFMKICFTTIADDGTVTPHSYLIWDNDWTTPYKWIDRAKSSDFKHIYYYSSNQQSMEENYDLIGGENGSYSDGNYGVLSSDSDMTTVEFALGNSGEDIHYTFILPKSITSFTDGYCYNSSTGHRIVFAGTSAQWNDITKPDDWYLNDSGDPAFEQGVFCQGDHQVVNIY